MTDMVRRLIIESNIFKAFHWLQPHHFEPLLRNERGSDAAEAIIEAITQVDKHSPDFSTEFVEKLAGLGGREKDRDQYEQILQLLSELLIAKKLVGTQWPSPQRLTASARVSGTSKDIEMLVESADLRIGYEVKTPKVLDQACKRAEADLLIQTRLPSPVIADLSASKENVLLPRDNAIKDFLASADAKFTGFKAAFSNFFSVLVIVVEDAAIQETISAIAGPVAGLLTDRSFAKKQDGTHPLYSNVDAVVLVRHTNIFVDGLAERGFAHAKKSILDYGSFGYPWKVIIQNPFGAPVPQIAAAALDAVPLDPYKAYELGKEYIAMDAITRMPPN